MPPRKVRRHHTAPSESSASENIEPSQLPPRDERPMRTCIFPKAASSEARILSLPNPSNGQLSRYLYCPRSGFFEFTQIKSPISSPQSCLLIPGPREDAADDTDTDFGNGYVIQDAHILVATPIDARLFLTPLFKPGMLNERGRPHMARLTEDLLEELARTSAHMRMLLRYPSARRLFEQELAKVCECVDALGETAYRLESLGLLSLLLRKAEIIVRDAWPPSLEKHVQKRLEIPAAIVAMRDASQSTSNDDQSEPGAEEAQQVNHTLDSPGRIRKTEQPPLGPSEEVIRQLRVRTALDFILSSYVPAKLKTYFEKVVSSPNCQMVDFQAMQTYLDGVEKLKTEAQALRSISDNVSRKRPAEEDDELQEARNEKRRKKDEEEKRRKQESRATKDLKKVDTSGMKKLSSFFNKKAAS